MEGTGLLEEELLNETFENLINGKDRSKRKVKFYRKSNRS